AAMTRLRVAVPRPSARLRSGRGRRPRCDPSNTRAMGVSADTGGSRAVKAKKRAAHVRSHVRARSRMHPRPGLAPSPRRASGPGSPRCLARPLLERDAETTVLFDMESTMLSIDQALPTEHYHLLADRLFLDPHAVFDAMREQNPIYRSPELNA